MPQRCSEKSGEMRENAHTTQFPGKTVLRLDVAGVPASHGQSQNIIRFRSPDFLHFLNQWCKIPLFGEAISSSELPLSFLTQ
jgi:hypothetical protein